MISFLFLIFFSLSAFAIPRDIEVWFVSNSKTTKVLESLKAPSFLFYSLTAQLQCQEMGEYCFDPQVGLYKKNDVSGEIVETKAIETDGPSIQAAKSVERELIDCDATNKFDIFCGKAKKQDASNARLDLWIDTSSSMREFDFQDKDGSCHRKSLVKELDSACGFNQKVNVMMFDTSIKQAGDMASLCNNQGLNDYKKLIDWIERSTAPKLVIITDIYGFHKEFSDYIESKHGKFRGDKDPLTAKQTGGLS